MVSLTLRQPWASLVIQGWKRYETRSWTTPYRGRLAIHSSSRMGREEIEWLCGNEDALKRLGYKYGDDRLRDDPPGVLPCGTVLGVVTLSEVRPAPEVEDILGDIDPEEMTYGDYSEGRFAWLLTEPHPLREPIPCRGMLGIWNLANDVASEVERSLEQFLLPVPTGAVG